MKFLYFTFAVLLAFHISCGSTPGLDNGSSGSGSDSDSGDSDSGGSSDSDDSDDGDSDGGSAGDGELSMEVEENGDEDNFPTNSELDDDTVILGCDEKDTADPETDFVKVTCTLDESNLIYIYYCEDGKVIREILNDDADPVELFDDTQVDCVDDDDSPDLEESELIVSLVDEI